MIVWVAGLPGIGKTTFLSRVARSSSHEFVEMDAVRHDVLCAGANFRRALAKEIDGYEGDWPLGAVSYEAIHATEQRYIRFHRALSEYVASRVEPRLRQQASDKTVLVELTSFWGPAFASDSSRAIALSSSPARHARNWQSRGWSAAAARELVMFYRSAYCQLAPADTESHIELEDPDAERRLLTAIEAQRA